MQPLSCAYTDRAHDWVREEARCIMRHFAVQRERESLDRGKAVRVTFNERKTLARLLFFPLSAVSVSLFRARSFQVPRRLLSPSLADRPENGP